MWESWNGGARGLLPWRRVTWNRASGSLSWQLPFTRRRPPRSAQYAPEYCRILQNAGNNARNQRGGRSRPNLSPSSAIFLWTVSTVISFDELIQTVGFFCCFYPMCWLKKCLRIEERESSEWITNNRVISFRVGFDRYFVGKVRVKRFESGFAVGCSFPSFPLAM